MKKNSGFRYEILLTLVFLIGAALLLMGVFMLKTMEKELISQRLRYAMDFSKSISQINAVEFHNSAEEIRFFTDALESQEIVSWAVFDADREPLYISSPDILLEGKIPTLPDFEPVIRVEFPHWQNLFAGKKDGYILISTPVNHGGRAKSLRIKFSLGDIRARLENIRTALLIFILLDGGLILLFGMYLLDRNLARPVRALSDSTQKISRGNFSAPVILQGPREIQDLGRSFDSMRVALDGSRRQTDAHIQELRDANLKLEKTRVELIRSEKMASVGHLAAGMAHEIGNPLGAAMGYLELLKAGLSDVNRNIADRTAGELERIDCLVRDLLDYAAPSEGGRESLDPAALVCDTVKLLQQQGAFGSIQVDTEVLSAPLPKITADRQKLEQLFVNLLLNARDACAPDGRIRISSLESEGLVRIMVDDNGCGISPKDRSLIFDPFFTTKDPGRGRGLGLAVCLRIAQEFGGDISAESRPGSGSVFTVALPAEGGDG